MNKLVFHSIRGRTSDIVDSVLQALHHEEDLHLRLAVEEVVQNIVSYAYQDDGELEVELSDDEACFIDSGQPFNPLEAPEPDLEAPVEERTLGGLGIFLAKQYTRLQYQYLAGKNCLTMHWNNHSNT